jgi:DNA-binding Lrp family transcriptional regulator
MSQTTTTRRRQELEKEGYIREYTLIPDFNKIGIEIVAFIFGYADASELTPERMAEAREWLSEQPEVLCNIEGQGLDSNFVQISVHKNYESYLEFLRRIRGEPLRSGHISGIFAISTGKTDLILKAFSLRQIESLLLPPEINRPRLESKKARR